MKAGAAETGNVYPIETAESKMAAAAAAAVEVAAFFSMSCSPYGVGTEYFILEFLNEMLPLKFRGATIRSSVSMVIQYSAFEFSRHSRHPERCAAAVAAASVLTCQRGVGLINFCRSMESFLINLLTLLCCRSSC